MFRAGIDLQLPQHLPPETILGQHPLDRMPDELLGLFLQQLLGSANLEPTWIPRMRIVAFVRQFFSGKPHLGGIDHNHEITCVEVRGERGLVLPAQDVGQRRGEPAKDLAVRIHDVPRSLDLAFGGNRRSHVRPVPEPHPWVAHRCALFVFISTLNSREIPSGCQSIESSRLKSYRKGYHRAICDLTEKGEHNGW